MISERQLANNYNSFWENIAPMLTSYILKINKSELKRFSSPVTSAISSGDRGLINETAFIVCTLGEFNTDNYEKALSLAHDKIKKLEKGDLSKNISIHEVKDLFYSFRRFVKLFSIEDSGIEYYPKFKGCGFLNGCEGDLAMSDTLFESKCGDRNFKGADLKQVLAYAALRYFELGKTYSQIGLVNARRGTCFFDDIDSICFSISGLSAIDLFEALRVFLEGQQVSK
ncbi:hypothetical protein ABMA79_04420 [Halobacteriovorax sp. HFRX-2_2]|uniref:hypothetical protein n=1 Tax=unclassified Halobacteriovorax TaxID=2639665 RepID=UPI0037242F9C